MLHNPYKKGICGWLLLPDTYFIWLVKAKIFGFFSTWLWISGVWNKLWNTSSANLLLWQVHGGSSERERGVGGVYQDLPEGSSDSASSGMVPGVSVSDELVSLWLPVPLSSFIEAAIALDNYIHPPRLSLHKPSWKAELMTHACLIESDSLNSSISDTGLPLSPLGTTSLTVWFISEFGSGS